jgi:outer membrane protein OmpA-like peptidoglycan-associated protein
VRVLSFVACLALVGACAKPPPPRVDRDRDGIFDDEDACPIVPGVASTSPATRGCPPPRLDMDADGIPDDEDACPRDPGSRFGDARKGCWSGPPDHDSDGVPDKDDMCPDVHGEHTWNAATNGCPLPPDRDHDGIADVDDACPDVPGKRSGSEKTTGCPPSTDKVRVEGDEIVLDDVIFFPVDSPHVRHASWPAVKRVASFLNATPDIITIDIAGHSDEVGEKEHNLQLSRDRAEAVKSLLVKFGVDGTKLTTHAFGEERPHFPGHTESAHKENRRVELTITSARVRAEDPRIAPPQE